MKRVISDASLVFRLEINSWQCIYFTGQLGLGDVKRRDEPTEVEALKGHTVIGAACGRNHTLFLTSRGLVFGAGDNKLGQCGVGKNDGMILTATMLKYSGAPIVKVSCGADFSMILDIKVCALKLPVRLEICKEI